LVSSAGGAGNPALCCWTIVELAYAVLMKAHGILAHMLSLDRMAKAAINRGRSSDGATPLMLACDQVGPSLVEALTGAHL